LEELDVTKQGWKELYGRTGIKKGYNGLFLEKVVTEAYAKMAATTTEADYNLAAQQFGSVLGNAQKEAKHTFEDTYYASADVALFSDAFVENAAEFLLKRLKEPVREVKETFVPSTLLTNQPVMFIPSGALSGYENSPILKAAFDEYVKKGGTLIVLTQKYGTDFAVIPTPDGKPITGYGWEEDINCFSDSLYIDTWHQMMSGQSRKTPTVNVDGYFTSWPDNSTILLRRTANGQPALLMYEHGLGRVILTSMYSDWAYGHGQASAEEIALVRDILTWAKKPAQLPETAAGSLANINLTVTNSTATDAATIKLQVYDPDRSTLLAEQSLSQPIAAGQNANLAFAYQTSATGNLGIQHIDYILLDASGSIIQPQAETDSGRFVVSKPPTELTKAPDFNFAVNSDSEHYASGSDATFTLTMYNHTDTERTITAKYFFPHHYWESGNSQYGGDWSHKDINLTRTLTVPAKGSASFIHTQNVWANLDRLWAYFYDENGVQVGDSSRGFYTFQSAVDVAVKTDKIMYTKGETVAVTCNLQNKQSAQTPVKLRVKASDPANGAVYINALDITMAPSAASVQTMSFGLPATAQGGFYTISAELFDSADNKIGGDSASIELLLSQVSVTPQQPAAWQTGGNMVAFTLANRSKIAVKNGTLDVALKDPDGAVAATATLPFFLDAGANNTITANLSLAGLRFGSYTLQYSQSDETRTGKPASVTLNNSPAMVATFDKPSYRIRETASLALQLTGGRFNLDNLTVAVAMPDAAFSAVQSVSITAGQTINLTHAIALPETLTAGQHTVNITLALPGGATTTQSVTLTVPQSALALTLAQTGFVAGSPINPLFANSGGVDTLAEYRLTLYDASSAQIAAKSATETLSAGAGLTTPLNIPVGAADGSYTLAISYRDSKTGKIEMAQKALTITGVKASLTLKSDKQAYLNTDAITAVSGITNSGTTLDDGKLHLQVSTAVGSQKQKSWTSQFDFQQGVREGVDTYGVNDGLIPDDDFDSVIDSAKWGAWGSVQTQNGKVLVDSTTYGSGISSSWTFAGDFDVQVDFSSNNSCGAEGASISANGGAFGFYVKNTANNGREAGALVNGGWTGWSAIGGYQQSGTLRIVRTGSMITGYNWNGTGWTYLLAVSGSDYTANPSIGLDVWRGHNCPANCKFDNFKVNSGRIVTKNETVDSVRLLQANDNFDDGVLNADRWSVRSSGSTTTNEVNGSLATMDTQAGVKSYSNVASRFPLEGDFDISIDWKTPVAPASGDWGSIFQINEMDQNTAPDNNLAGNALQIKRAYVNGLGHVYQTGHYNGTTWDSLSSPVTTTDTSGKFRMKRTGSLVTVWYWNSSLNRWEWNNDTVGYTWSGVWTTPSFIQFGTANNAPGDPAAEASWNNFKVDSGTAYLGKAAIHLKQDAGQTSNWQTISWHSTEPIGTSVKFRARTAENEGDLANALWVDYVTSGSPITNPKGRWIELEAILATTNTSATPLLNDVTVTYGSSQGDLLWQTDVPINLAQGAVADFTNAVGTLGNAGKYYLQGGIISSTGQAIATSESAFFVAQGNTALSVLPDKRVYRPGETVTITGEVRNLAAVEAANLSLLLKGKLSGGVEQALLTEAFTLPAGGSHPFTVTTTAGTEGTITLTGAVTQSSATLAEIADQYEVAAPKVTATLTAPDTVGNDPFTMSLQLANSGKTDATVTVGKSFSSLLETVTIPAGQTRLLQYPQQISADTAYTFTLTGDLTQTVSKMVKYGLAGNIIIIPQTLYPEGKIAIPATITNSGLLDGQYGVSWQLTQAATVLNQQSATYYIAKGGNAADSLSYNLTEGSYQLSATGQLPALAVATNLVVRKEIKADLTQMIGTQSGASLPVSATVTNLGFNAISGVVRLSLLDGQGSAVWSAGQEVNLPQSLAPAPQTLAFTINLSAVKPGDYTVKTELLDSDNKQLATQTAPFRLLAPIFSLTQTPPYQTFQPGASGTFTFKIKNSGNREGVCTLAFKAGDLYDSSRTEWLKPGDEKELSFTTTLPVDLDEKDYTAAYRLTGNGITVAEDVVRYHLAGISLNVTASLNRQQYRPGESATFTLTVDQPAGTAPLEMFARVHYSTSDEKRNFTLSGAQSLTFTVPLTAITGEKLAYGIYHQSGRSIHLNTTYVTAANDLLAISSDKQVYNPGETVAVSVQGSAVGDLLLTGPGGFSATLAFNGSASSSMLLPNDLLSGTYKIAAAVTDATGTKVTAEHPIDVTGLKVTLREARLDKAVYAAADTMKLTVTAESNQDLSALLRTWVVDPGGTYSEAGESAVSLSASSPSLFTLNSSLLTGSMGIHKLVYGIYRGNDLIASGAKAFDIGNALVTAVSTDKREYAGITEPVTVKTELFGATTGELALQLDGVTVQTTSVTLSGFGTETAIIPAATVTPGRHSLKAQLTSGGLASVRETEFIFGTDLPDLIAGLMIQAPNGQEVAIRATVANQGKSVAGTSSLTLYDGNPATGGAIIAVLPVAALDAGATATVSYTWNILGKSGNHLLYAVTDCENRIAEFDKRNNTAMTTVYLPTFAISAVTGKSLYGGNEDVAISIAVTNLSSAQTIENVTLKISVAAPVGTVINLPDVTIASIAPATTNTVSSLWNSGVAAPGIYTVSAVMASGTPDQITAATTFSVMVNAPDIIPPVVTVVEPSQGSTSISVVHLTAVVTDTASRVERVEYQLDGGVWKPLAVSDSSRGLYDAIWTPTVADNGNHKVNFRGTDLVGNTSIPVSVNFSVNIDSTPPTLHVSTLADNSYTNNSVLNISGTATDIGGIKVLTINTTPAALNQDGSFSYAMKLAPGANRVEISAVDQTGNQTSDIRIINLDQNAPLLTISSPADNSKTAVALMNVTGVLDEKASVSVKVGGIVQSTVMSGNGFTAAVTLVPGINTIEVTATDLADNTSTQKRTVVYDNQTPSVAMAVPVQDIRTNQSTLLLKGTASDPHTSVVISIVMDGQIFTPPVVAGQFEQLVSFNSEKSYAIVVTATNEVGRSATVQRNVIYDITSPALTINPVTSPASQPEQSISGMRESGTTVSISCPTATVGAVSYPAETTWSVLISDLKPGENLISAISGDLAGNTTTVSAKITRATPGTTMFTHALFAHRSVTLSGSSYLDSYVGATSAYVAGKYKHGNVGIDSTQLCGIKLSGGAMVYGSASVGVGGSPATAVCTTNGTSITGGSSALAVVKDLTPVAVPTGFASLGTLNLSGVASKTLTAGIYRYSSINLTGSGKLATSGQVTLIVDGTFSISGAATLTVQSGSVVIYVNGAKLDISGGSLVNTTQVPANLVIYGGAALTTVNLSGGTTLHGYVYAPAAAVKVSGSQQTFGAIIGNTVDLSGATSIHFPEGL
jgi:hypothetical protein